MNRKTGGNRRSRLAGAPAVVGVAAAAAMALALAACGGGAPASAGSASGLPTFTQEVALAHCIRGHGVPDFPDPGQSGGFNASVLATLNAPQGQKAYGACRHLLADGGPSLTRLQHMEQQALQALQKKLPELLKFARCMRGHGLPDYPDPTVNGQGVSENLNAAGMDPNSPLFQDAFRACQHVAPGLKLSRVSSSHAS